MKRSIVLTITFLFAGCFVQSEDICERNKRSQIDIGTDSVDTIVLPDRPILDQPVDLGALEDLPACQESS